jgi:hypothetical protein
MAEPWVHDGSRVPPTSLPKTFLTYLINSAEEKWLGHTLSLCPTAAHVISKYVPQLMEPLLSFLLGYRVVSTTLTGAMSR